MSFLLAFAPRYTVFVLCVVVLGAVAGLHYSTAASWLSRTYGDIGTTIGIHTIGAPAGGLLAPVAATWIGVRYGWRPAVAIGAVITVPVFALFILPRPSDRATASRPAHARSDAVRPGPSNYSRGPQSCSRP